MQPIVIFTKLESKYLNAVCLNKLIQPGGCFNFCMSEGIYRLNKITKFLQL